MQPSKGESTKAVDTVLWDMEAAGPLQYKSLCSHTGTEARSGLAFASFPGWYGLSYLPRASMRVCHLEMFNFRRPSKPPGSQGLPHADSVYVQPFLYPHHPLPHHPIPAYS